MNDDFQNALLTKIADRLTNPDNGDVEFISLADALETADVPDHVAELFQMAAFFNTRAVLDNEPRLMYAAMAVMALTGMLDTQFHAISDVMDMADTVWSSIAEATEHILTEEVEQFTKSL
jgi:hypothetical protein